MVEVAAAVVVVGTSMNRWKQERAGWTTARKKDA
jgi:hypothetical protein